MEKNIPEFFKEILNEQYGKELSKDIIYNLNKPKKVTLRVNTIKSDANEIISVFEKENI